MEPALLYLDTARLGLMKPGAQRAHLDITRLAGAEGASLFFERFLRTGAGDWASQARNRYPGLASWKGVGGLKASLRTLTGSVPDLPVLIAARSAALMKFAARLLCHHCHNVLVTDLGWPTYHHILEAECDRRNRLVTLVPLREAFLAGVLTDDEAGDCVSREYQRHACDGLFLTAVSNTGVRLPVERIVRAARAAAPMRFVVVDGAQAFGHVPPDLPGDHFDLYLTGCHKWLGAFHPLGLAFYGRSHSHAVIDNFLSHLVRHGKIDDPLLRVSTQLEVGVLDGITETVSLAPLFSCHGAVSDTLTKRPPALDTLPCRLRNVSVAAELGMAAGWRPLLPPPASRTGIPLLEAEREKARQARPDEVRSAFYGRGIALTAYEEGRIRLSMPARPWRTGEAEHLASALRAAA